MSFFKKLWGRLIYSPLLQNQNHSRKIAYLGLLTAFSVVANAFFEIKLGEIQFSLTIFVCFLIGALAGAGYGFFVCFLGDMIGFIIHPFGAYLPSLGVSVGLMSLFSGALLSDLMKKTENKPTVYVLKSILGIPFFGKKKTLEKIKLFLKITFVCLLSFFVCTVGITHTTFFYLYAGGRSYLAYFVYRFLLQGQLYNCIFNYLLMFLGFKFIKKLFSLAVKNQ